MHCSLDQKKNHATDVRHALKLQRLDVGEKNIVSLHKAFYYERLAALLLIPHLSLALELRTMARTTSLNRRATDAHGGLFLTACG